MYQTLQRSLLHFLHCCSPSSVPEHWPWLGSCLWTISKYPFHQYPWLICILSFFHLPHPLCFQDQWILPICQALYKVDIWISYTNTTRDQLTGLSWFELWDFQHQQWICQVTRIMEQCSSWKSRRWLQTRYIKDRFQLHDEQHWHLYKLDARMSTILAIIPWVHQYWQWMQWHVQLNGGPTP